jgi:hypothetical protein
VVRQPCLHEKFRTRSPRPSHRQPGAGGVSPPWTLFHIRTRSAEVHCICRHRLQYHGGLTLAALVNMRSPIAKIAFLPADARTATRSGGRQPPWFGNRACKGDSAHVHHDRRTDNQERGASAPRGFTNALATTIPQYARDCRRRTGEPHSNRSSQNHGAPIAVCVSPCMCVVEPRRAHARRSCARAFVHREWRFMQCTNVAHQERSV